MIAVTFALPTESATFTRLLKQQQISATDVHVVHTGVGRAATERAMRELLSEHSPDLLISSGFAGALTDELEVADVFLAQNFTSPDWLDRSRASLEEDARIGVLATATAITDSTAHRAQLATRTGAIAVDMETEFIAAACQAASVPTIALRAISDTPAAPMPAPPSVLFDVATQKTNYAVLARHVATHPAALPRLIAFSRRIAIVREKLATALVRLLKSAR